MSKILVSLISEQTIPNVIAALHFKPQKHLFITTKRSEQDHKSESTKDFLVSKKVAKEEDFIKIEVNQDDFLDVNQKVNKFIEEQSEEGNEFIVNITCGNKIMALAVYEQFRNSGKETSIGYIPLGTNRFIQIFPSKTPLKIIEIKERISTMDYLSVYNFATDNINSLENDKEEARKRKEETMFIIEHFEQLKPLLSFFSDTLRDQRNSKTYYFERNYHTNSLEKQLLHKLSFAVEDKKIKKNLQKAK
jgi:hypothetical protein